MLYVDNTHPVGFVTLFYLYNKAFCCILSVFLWRYSDDGRNSNQNMYIN